jgi:hypothetical protein
MNFWNLFDTFDNEKFFNPLTGENRTIYFQIIQALIAMANSREDLYEQDAKNKIFDYQSLLEEEAMGSTPNDILKYFEECGWIRREQSRNGLEYYVRITSECRILMDGLMSVRRGADNSKGHIFAMYEIVRAASDDTFGYRRLEPYKQILEPLEMHKNALKNELIDLRDNILALIKKLLDTNELSHMGHLLSKEEMIKDFFNNYFRLKNDGNVLAFIPVIINYCRKLEYEDDALIEKMVYDAPREDHVNQETIRLRLSSIISFLDYSYEDNMNIIENRIDEYYVLANQRIRMRLTYHDSLHPAIERFFQIINNHPDLMEESVENINKKCINIVNQSFIARQSFDLKKKRDMHKGRVMPIKPIVIDEDTIKKEQELLSRSINRAYSKHNVAKYMDGWHIKEKVHINKDMIKNKKDVLTLIAALMYVNNEDFPYEINITDQRLVTDFCEMPDMIIRRRK